MTFNFKNRFKGKFFAGLIAGFCDEMKCYTDAEIKEADVHRNFLDVCMPPSKWFSKEDYSKAIYHLRKKDISRALKSLGGDPGKTKQDVCVYVFQQVFLKIIMGAPKLLSDALPTTYI